MTSQVRSRSRVMLISNSIMPGQPFLSHVMPAIRSFLGPRVRTIAFVPNAQHDRRRATKRVADALAPHGFEVIGTGASSIDVMNDVSAADAIYVGGGNTFMLLEQLQRMRMLGYLRERVRGGQPYIGVSAGANIAGPSICTTNDMPIAYPPDGFQALQLVDFQLNPHYIDAPAVRTHGGETRAERIAEFHAHGRYDQSSVYRYPVIGLREGAHIIVHGSVARLGGQNGAHIFRANGRHSEWDGRPIRFRPN